MTRSHYVLSEAMLRAPRPGGDHGLEPGAGLAARPRRQPAPDAIERAARARPGGAHGQGGAQPPVGDHPLGGQRADVHARPQAGNAPVPARRRASRRATSTPRCRSRSTSRAGPGYGEQFAYERFDMIGINQYFGWYPWVEDFNALEPFLREMRDLYPDHALVMTEFGAEGRPDMADAPADEKGSYALPDQARGPHPGPGRPPAVHVGRHPLDAARVRDLPRLARRRRVERPGRNTRHHKGVLTYNGERKPAWSVLRDHFARTPALPEARLRPQLRPPGRVYYPDTAGPRPSDRRDPTEGTHADDHAEPPAARLRAADRRCGAARARGRLGQHEPAVPDPGRPRVPGRHRARTRTPTMRRSQNLGVDVVRTNVIYNKIYRTPKDRKKPAGLRRPADPNSPPLRLGGHRPARAAGQARTASRS